ncbi:MAG: cell division protein FtsZ [Anaerolineales bacterium]|nr:MAG: cell division protein FtsZ [Anaerolineales bacterium]
MEDFNLETQPTKTKLGPVIKVVGLGGGGGNAVDRMIELGLENIDFIAANTDYQVLQRSLAPTKVQLGPLLTRGLGAGGNPEIGRQAAIESRKELEAALEGADMVFLTAGMGGGTGTGSIAIAGEVARELGAVTIAVVTMPFSFEMGRRLKNAQEGLAMLQPNTDTLIAIPNDRLLYVAPQDLPLETAFRMADDVLRQSVQGIAELVTQPGLINVDFAHVRNMMLKGGGALMAIGQGTGQGKAVAAVQQALNHPLLESVSLKDASGVIANFSGGDDLTLFEVGEALGYLRELVNEDVEVVMGVSSDERMTERTQVILVVTGIGAKSLEEVLPGAEKLHPVAVTAAPAKVVAKAAVPAMAAVGMPAEMNGMDVVPDEIGEGETEPSESAFQAGVEAKPVRTEMIAESMPAMPVDVLNDLDVPAFMRKRARFNLRVGE